MCFVAPFRLHAWDLAAATACVWGPPASYSHELTHCAVARSRSRRLAHRGAGDGLPKLLDQLPPGLREPTLDPARPGSGARPLRSRPPQPPRPDEEIIRYPETPALVSSLLNGDSGVCFRRLLGQPGNTWKLENLLYISFLKISIVHAQNFLNKHKDLKVLTSREQVERTGGR